MGYAFNPFTGSFDNTGSGGSVSIGDAIGNSPDSNGILYVDSSGNLQNDILNNTTGGLFGGAVPYDNIGFQTTSNVSIYALSLGAFGVADAIAYGGTGTPYSFYLSDLATLTSYFGILIDPVTTTNSFFGVGLGSGINSAQEMSITSTAAQFTVPLTLTSSLTFSGSTTVSSILDEDTMSSDSATALATQQSIKAYVDANAGAVDSVNGYTGTVVLGIDDVAPTQTGNSGKYLTTDGTNASWGTITLPTPGGSNTQIQYNDSGSFGGSSSFTWNNSTGTLTATGRYNKFGGGTASVSANGFLYKNSTVIDAASGAVRGAEFNPSVRATANNDELVGTYFTFTPDENSFTGLNQYMVYYQNTYANAVPLKIRAAPSQSADILQIVDNSNSDVFTISNVGRYYQTMLAGNLTETLGSAMSTEARSGYTSAGTTYARYLNFITANSASSSYWGEYIYVQTDGSGAISVDDMGGIDTFVYYTPTSGTAQDLFGHRIRLGSTGTSSQNAYNIYIRDASGSTMTNLYGLYIESLTDGTNSNYAIYTNSGGVRFGDRLQIRATNNYNIGSLDVELTSTYTGSVEQYAAALKVTAPNAASGKYVGLYGQARIASSNSTERLIGFRGDGQLEATSSATNVIGGAMLVANYGSGTLTNGYGMYIYSAINNGGGTFTNNYGLYIESQTAGGTDYAIYTNSGTVRFGDQLQLSASTTSRATLNIPSGTAPTTPVDGDIWSDGSDIKVRLGGTTYTLTKT